RVEYTPASALLIGYANFIGNELPDSVPAETRIFNQAFARVGVATGTAAWVTVDYGTQAEHRWYGLTLVARHPLSARVAINGRLERYADPDQVIIASLGAGGFEATGASLGLDVSSPAGVAGGAPGGVLWRTELRGFWGDRPLFPQRGGGLGQRSGFIVTSLALSL
ncbi:MAG TPA: outer membrane beta-barrel protein, partial [Gemmatimonadales bacterium]|nr:outer membrane beta-barrel protein [Gemmatimonadales bacterium]